MRAPILVCGIVLSALAGAAHARLLEETLDLPVTVVDAYGKQIAHSIKVTVFSDDQNPQPAPVLVLNHGRATDAQGRLVRLSPRRFVHAAARSLTESST
jgi:hypothetical protein